MKKLILPIVALAISFSSCNKEEDPIVINQGDYPAKEYYLERDPKVNIWGAGMDFVHSECKLSETDLDYKYMELDDDFTYDLNFYIVKAYYYDENNDLQSEGCPAILLSPQVKICKLGEGLNFFDSLTVINEEMLAELQSDQIIDYNDYMDESTGFYEREQLYAALDGCIIGQSFRSNILVVPDGQTEEEVQAVYLVQTIEGAYAKFMVQNYKPAKPNEKKTLVKWQVISE